MKQTKKPSGSYPIQFNSTHRKCQKNMINCGGPFFPDFVTSQEMRPSSQRFRSMRTWPRRAVSIASRRGTAPPPSRSLSRASRWRVEDLIGYFLHGKIIPFQWVIFFQTYAPNRDFWMGTVFFQFRIGIFSPSDFQMGIFFKLVIVVNIFTSWRFTKKKFATWKKNTSPSFESETIPPLRKLPSWDLRHIPSQLGTFEWMFFQLPFPFGGIC